MTTAPALSLKLNDGHSIPSVGLGCWIGRPGVTGENQETELMVKTALEVGYRHLDCASYYGNEEALGKAIRESGIPRSEIYVTTKMAGPDHFDAAIGLDKSLKALGMDYVDLYLIHWPQASDPKTGATIPFGSSPTFNETWAGMEALVATGKVRSIGVSNFSVKNLKLLLKTAKIVPAVNQVQGHPYLPNASLHEFCKEVGIHLTAYSPLGQVNSPILSDPAVVAIAKSHSATTAQIVLSWGVMRGWSVVPKSGNRQRMTDNFQLIHLSSAEFEEISKLHAQPGKLKGLCDYGEGGKVPGSVIGWTFEEMGWEVLD